MATAAEITAEIAEIDAALRSLRKGGQSYLIMSSAGGGTQRSVTMADYSALVKHKMQLQDQLASKNNTRAVRIRPGW